MVTQIKHIDRIIFLKKFTEEIIKNLSKKHDIQRKIRIEKLKDKFNIQNQESTKERDDAFKKILNHKILGSPRYPDPRIQNKKEEPPSALNNNINEKKIFLKKPLRNFPPQKYNQKLTSLPETIPIQEEETKESIEASKLNEIKPEFSDKPVGFSLGKINELIKDPFVQSIECTGPGKNILVKKYNKINLTKWILSQEEIGNIINSFSEHSKIPLIGGILKAAVGDLIISAVESKHVGSRFIINRIEPTYTG
jgi:hypothetical protein